jgi:predicted outer membrane repeat protein
MKPKKVLKTTAWLFLAMATLIWYNCYPPVLEVIQPDAAEKDSSFEASVWITGPGGYDNREATEIISKVGLELPPEWLDLERSGDVREENWLYFGVKLPLGWEVTNPIPFHGVAEGNFVHSDSLTAAMANLEPPEPGYCWWVSETVEPISTSSGTIEFYPVIHTDGQSGNFFIDYMLGCNGSLNDRRNNDHYIGVGLADTSWVTSPAENGPGSIRAAIDSVNPGGHIFFDFDLLATINLSEQIVVYKSFHIHGPKDKSIIISGNDSCRVFFVQSGKELCIEDIQILQGNADNGGAVYCSRGSTVQFDHVKIRDNHAIWGGGIYCEDEVSITLKNSQIRNNHAESGGGKWFRAGSGGGIFFRNVDGYMENTTVCENTATQHGGGIYFSSVGNIHFDTENRCNIYQNSSYLGFDLYKEGGAIVNVIVDTFTVAWPNTYFAFPFRSFNIDLIHHAVEQYQQDLYVSPDGSDENPGITPGQPKKTITNALTYIKGSAINPNTIHLAPGIYSLASNGEHFPLYCHSHVSISGSPEDSVILSGEDGNRLFEITGTEGIILDRMILQNASASGIFCQNASVSVTGVTIRNCSSAHPAIDIFDCSNINLSLLNGYNNGNYYWEFYVIRLTNSTATLTDSEIHSNTQGIALNNSQVIMERCDLYDNDRGGLTLKQQSAAELVDCSLYGNSGPKGAGISCFEGSALQLSGCLLRENEAWEMGGGIYLESSTVSFNSDVRCNIYLNEAPLGRDLYSASSPSVHVVVDTFTVLYPSCYFTVPISEFTFDILHGKIPQYDQDLFVSPSGSDENTGLTPDDPLMSVTKAIMTICTPGGAHTIHLAPGTYSPSLTREQLPIQCQDSVSIRGEPDSVTILDGENVKRVIHAQGVDGIVLGDVCVTNGSSDYGGGIYAEDADLTLQNVLVHYNSATEGGGGMYVEGSTRITAENATISHNTAGRGGGIFLDSTDLMLSNMILSHNRNIGGSSACSGGGIFCNQSDAVFHDLLLESNESSSGGGLSLQSSSPTLLNVTFSDNEAMFSGGGICLTGNSNALLYDVEFNANKATDGGGLYCEESQPVIVHCSFVDNHASGNGAGMYIEHSDPGLSDVQIKGNVADHDGGGLYLGNHSMPFIFGTVIYANEAQNGGGVFSTSHSNPYLSGSYITNNAGHYGGGLYCTDEASLTFDPESRCNIFFNRAHDEGADLYNNGYQIIPVVVDTFTVLNPSDFFAYKKDRFEFDIWNYKLTQGEYDIYVSPEGSDDNTGHTPEDPLLSITSAFTRCMTDTVPPYKIYLAPGTYSPSTTNENFPLFGRSDIWLLGADSASTFLNGDSTQIFRIMSKEGILLSDITLTNGRDKSTGGGIYCENASLSLVRAAISNCSADDGGGLYMAGPSDLTMQDVRILNNLARYGGGLYCEGVTFITGNNITISGNRYKWPGYGGGIYCRNVSGQFHNLSVFDNEALKGGGISLYRSSPVICNSVISCNAAGKGGALYINRADSLKLINVTASGNAAPTGGAIFTTYDAFIHLTNCIFWENNEYGIYLGDGGLTVYHSDIHGGPDNITIHGDAWVDWQESINEDPLFSATGAHPFSLTEGSPCIDAGTTDTTGLFLPPWDLAGNLRIWDGDGDGVAVIDMGAYEYNGMPVGKKELQVAGCRLQVFPNPSFGISDIRYRISDIRYISLEIYDVHGQRVRKLVHEKQQAGEYVVRLRGSDLPAGIYLVRLQAGEVVETVKALVLR